ncbi:cbb3-type cytochrome oxidase assembly protein CcoS [Flagellimonas sp.]|uniref:cbb3-type cytochrome oxidase assembly protein CcoS n=1 Tax=Flagellimonas sp. TaxID=2058762 RepID=UPI003F4A7DED
MSVIYVLLTISICVALIFFMAFIRSVRAGQYDDSYTPSVRMLFEDELVLSDEDTQIKKSEITNQNKDTNQ